ncbi:class I SAM-dependent methyltransferase [Ectothiorhodospira lacustris]|uniref:class I SAM-dependent methyltransferase n=1 Tax=Ectothiorhodospira lacustris TaxID=2899127 RepID=UPI001EE861C3|nr:methyltransferase domain-containing protein [Ectothiorhodospira lacustris]MCG5499600.1 class I SAM-dependent methyltransferase [Ectothiorhodospira lacustris]MCG5508706.1 class I SAM-dependent methyltransferase [Ectothiorhodospira lacustris]MCG5520497.1 class I SAM-dependent methyltransferase [Ectothiorhodospira lacustris]
MQAALQSHLDRFVPQLFGYHALQIGHLSPDHDLLSTSRINHRVRLECEPGQGDLSALADALPILTDSMDLVLLVHCLEQVEDPYQVLRETDRILVPEGHVLIIGCNPLSLPGLWGQLPGRSGSKGGPWSGHCHATGRVRDWLSLLGFEVLARAYAGFRPPEGRSGFRVRLRVVESLGGRHLPYLGGAYVILARKRVANVMHLRTRWRPSRSMVPSGLASPFCRRTDRD